MQQKKTACPRAEGNPLPVIQIPLNADSNYLRFPLP